MSRMTGLLECASSGTGLLGGQCSARSRHCRRRYRGLMGYCGSAPLRLRGQQEGVLLMVVSLREFIFVGVGSIVLSLVVLAAVWPWAREVRRLAAIGVSIAVGIVL